MVSTSDNLMRSGSVVVEQILMQESYGYPWGGIGRNALLNTAASVPGLLTAEQASRFSPGDCYFAYRMDAMIFFPLYCKPVRPIYILCFSPH